MTNSILYFRFVKNMLNFSFVNERILTKKNYVLFILVLCPFVYNNDIHAFNITNYDDLQNSSPQYFEQNDDLTMTNYPNSNTTNLTNNSEDSIYGQIESFENNIYVVWQESVTETLPEHNYDIFFIKSEDNGKTFSKAINLSNRYLNSQSALRLQYLKTGYLLFGQTQSILIIRKLYLLKVRIMVKHSVKQ